MKCEMVKVEVTMKRESAKSVGCDVGKEKLCWFPKSQIEDFRGFIPDKPTTIKIPLWLAQNEELV